MRVFRFLPWIACALCAPSVARAASRTGVVLEAKRVHVIRAFSGLTEQKEDETYTLSRSGVRIDTASSRVTEAYVIGATKAGRGSGRRGKGASGKGAKVKETRYRWNKSTKVYAEKDLAQLRAEDEAIRLAMEKQRRQMAQRSRGGPPGTMLGALAGLSRQADAEAEGKITTRRSGKKVKIAGYTCEHVEFVQGEEVVCEVWVATKLKKIRKVSDLAAAKKLWLENNDALKARPKLLAARLAVEGIELKSIVRKVAGQHYTIEVTKVTEKTIPSSAFKPPAGFRKVDRDYKLYLRPKR